VRARAVAAVAVVVLAGCSGGHAAPTLAQSDPEGWAACSALIRSSTTTDARAGLDALLEAGVHAQGASTDRIRAAVGGSGVPDVGALRAACGAAGVRVPVAVAKS
jgi:hypothetical protein